jgi:hypothetical protein
LRDPSTISPEEKFDRLDAFSGRVISVIMSDASPVAQQQKSRFLHGNNDVWSLKATGGSIIKAAGLNCGARIGVVTSAGSFWYELDPLQQNEAPIAGEPEQEADLTIRFDQSIGVNQQGGEQAAASGDQASDACHGMFVVEHG